MLKDASKNYMRVEQSRTGRFTRFNEEIGSGSFKTVFRAIDNDTGREVAWNVVSTSGLSTAEKEGIREEILMIQKLEHKNIIHFIKAWYNKDKEEVVFITEIMTGGSLKNFLKKIKHPHLRVIKQWCKEILCGLEYLHSQEPYPIIHRDLKCDNVFVSACNGEIRIGDLGLSTFMKSSHHKTITGTPQYMAPELFEERYGPSVDIYSFGMCVIEMCTLETPYSECKTPYEVYNKIISGDKPIALGKIADSELKEFILLCLEPVDRRPFARELLNHSFLIVDEKDERVHLPVQLCSEQEAPEPPKLEEEHIVRMSITIALKDAKGNVRKEKLDFDFDTHTDTPEGIAQEIIDHYSLAPKQLHDIAAIIHEKLPCGHSDLSSRNSSFEHKLLSFDCRPSPFSTGNISPIEEHHMKELEQKEHFQSVLTFLEEIECIQIPPFHKALSRLGENGREEVAALQNALREVVGYPLKSDGRFGSSTERCVQRFQEDSGLLVNGVVTKPVWDRLMREYERKKRRLTMVHKDSSGEGQPKLIARFSEDDLFERLAPS